MVLARTLKRSCVLPATCKRKHQRIPCSVRCQKMFHRWFQTWKPIRSHHKMISPRVQHSEDNSENTSTWAAVMMMPEVQRCAVRFCRSWVTFTVLFRCFGRIGPPDLKLHLPGSAWPSSPGESGSPGWASPSPAAGFPSSVPGDLSPWPWALTVLTEASAAVLHLQGKTW